MALATLHLAAIPLLAGLAAGTGAVATYVATPAEAPATAAAQVQPCEAQTWPYIDRACVSDVATTPRKVRVVTTTRPEDAFDARWSDLPGMTSSDGVLRAPQNVDAIPTAPAAAPAKQKRSETKPAKPKRVTAQRYTVPAERRGATREVYVVRPMRLDLFR